MWAEHFERGKLVEQRSFDREPERLRPLPRPVGNSRKIVEMKHGERGVLLDAHIHAGITYFKILTASGGVGWIQPVYLVEL
jgi:hypothetical protein